MDNVLVDWITKETENRGWSMRELARRANLSHATISNVLSQQRRPGWDFCVGIAQAFQVPPETVFRKAGLLPSKPETSEQAEEALHLFQQLSPEKQRLALKTLRAWLKE